MDKFTFTNTQIIGFFIPGFAFLMILFFGYTNWDLAICLNFLSKYNSITTGFIILVSSIFLGLVIDAIRNGIIETVLDEILKKYYFNILQDESKKDPNKYRKNEGMIYWDFFNEAPKNKITKLYSKYYIYYIFDVNSITALFLSYSISVVCFGSFSFIQAFFITGILLVLLFDSWSLRKDVYFHTNVKLNEKVSS